MIRGEKHAHIHTLTYGTLLHMCVTNEVGYKCVMTVQNTTLLLGTVTVTYSGVQVSYSYDISYIFGTFFYAKPERNKQK